jgi:hypothetical protein
VDRQDENDKWHLPRFCPDIPLDGLRKAQRTSVLVAEIETVLSSTNHNILQQNKISVMISVMIVFEHSKSEDTLGYADLLEMHFQEKLSVSCILLT